MNYSSQSSLNILQVCLSPYLGGMELFSLELSEQLNKTHSVTLLVQADTELENHAKNSDVPKISINFFNYADFYTIYKIRNIVQTYNIDVVHHHGSTEMGLLSPSLLGLSSVKLFNHKHILISSDKTDCYHRLIYNRCDGIIVPTPNVRENVLTKYPVAPDNIYTLPHARNIKRYQSSQKSSPLSSYRNSPSTNFIATISRLTEGKGLELFIRTARRVLQNHDEYYFFIVGDGNERYKKKLESMIPADLEDNIVLIGYQEDIPAILNDTDLYLSLSEGESFGLTILEAMMSGVPILARNVTGHQYLLRRHKKSLLPKNVGPAEVAKKIKDYFQNSLSLPTEYDVSDYTFKSYCDKLEDLYQQ